MNRGGTIQPFQGCNQKPYIAVLAGLIAFMTIVTGICNQIHIGELLVFVCFQILCVILPGAAAMAVIPVKNLRRIEKLTLVYASGYMLTMALYAALMITVGSGYVRLGFALLPILSCVILALKRDRRNDFLQEITEDSGDVIWIGAVLAVFFVSLIVFSMRWKIPYTAGSNNYETDFVYWAGDIVSLTKQFPPKEFRTLNPIYRYHYFGALQQAAVSVVTGIQAVKVAVCYSYVEGAVLLGLSSYALVGRMIKNKTAQALTLLLMLFSTGFEEAAVVTYIWHIYQIPMSYHIAQSLGIIVVVLLLAQLKNEKMDLCNLVWSMCLLICCFGTKSSAGAVIFCGVVAAYFYLFLSKSSRRAACIAAGAFLLVFLAAGIWLWPVIWYFNLALNLPDIRFGSGAQIAQSMRACIVWIGKYCVETAAANCWTFIPAGVYSIYLVIRRSINKEHILFIMLVLVGTMGNYLVSFNGGSQMYFAFIAFPFAAVLAGRLIETIFHKYLPQNGQYLAAGLLGAAAIIFMLRNNYMGYFGYNFMAGLRNIGTPNMVEEGQCLLTVTQAQCEAYCWIRENTQEDVVLLSDRMLENLHDPTSVFSERYIYIYHDFQDDYMRVVRTFAGDQEAVRYYAELGLDYIVLRKFSTPLFRCPEDVGEVVFENSEIAVYKLFWGQRGKTGVFY